MDRERNKPKTLEVYSPFVFGHVEVVEIGQYDPAAPCVSLGVWPGSGYLRSLFVVWNCEDMEEALDIWAAKAVAAGWTDLYMDELSEDDDEETTDWISIGWSVSVWVYGPELAIKEYESGAAYVDEVKATYKATRDAEFGGILAAIA